MSLTIHSRNTTAYPIFSTIQQKKSAQKQRQSDLYRCDNINRVLTNLYQMTTMTTTHDQVIHLISDICRVPSTRIHALTSLRDDLHLDTVDLTLLIASLENNFKVYLTVEEANAIETVQDVSHFMQRHAA